MAAPQATIHRVKECTLVCPPNMRCCCWISVARLPRLTDLRCCGRLPSTARNSCPTPCSATLPPPCSGCAGGFTEINQQPSVHRCRVGEVHVSCLTPSTLSYNCTGLFSANAAEACAGTRFGSKRCRDFRPESICYSQFVSTCVSRVLTMWLPTPWSRHSFPSTLDA